jgi:hypothetical protein
VRLPILRPIVVLLLERLRTRGRLLSAIECLARTFEYPHKRDLGLLRRDQQHDITIVSSSY